MNEKQLIRTTEETLLHTYQRFPVVFERGKGVTLTDVNGKRYLDFASGIGVVGLGYGDQKFDQALKDQIDRLIHTSNLFYHVPQGEAAKKALSAFQMDRIFFTNSGTEAIEGALKAARKYYFSTRGKAGGRIIAMEESFHGRSMGALSVTGNEHYRAPFEPLVGGVDFARFNDMDSIRRMATEETCAVLLETVQGEGGIFPAEEGFLRELRAFCDEKDILLIFDEIQCGMGRTGEYAAWQNFQVKPDLQANAKALGNGIPVGAFSMTERVAERSLVPGDHGTTYGGNPLATAAVSAVFDRFEEEGILAHVREIAPRMAEVLEEIRRSTEVVKDHRGLGLMRGLELTVPVGEVVKEALQEGLVLISAGHNTLRFLPPLVVTESDLEEMKEKLVKILQKR